MVHGWAFDFDDTIVTTTACIQTTSHGRLTTAEYARHRGTPLALHQGSFKELDSDACELRPAGAYGLWRRALKTRQPMIILTARACNSKIIMSLLRRSLGLRKGSPVRLHRNIKVLSVNSPSCLKAFSKRYPTAASRKYAVLKNHMRKHAWDRATFVDDDLRNLRAVGRLGKRVELRSGRTARKLRPCQKTL